MATVFKFKGKSYVAGTPAMKEYNELLAKENRKSTVKDISEVMPKEDTIRIQEERMEQEMREKHRGEEEEISVAKKLLKSILPKETKDEVYEGTPKVGEEEANRMLSALSKNKGEVV